MPKTYTQQHMPVHKGNIPRQQDLQAWPHLNSVHLPEIDASIDVLIVTDVPKALEPLQVICILCVTQPLFFILPVSVFALSCSLCLKFAQINDKEYAVGSPFCFLFWRNMASEGAAVEPRLHRLSTWFDPESAAVRGGHSTGVLNLNLTCNLPWISIKWLWVHLCVCAGGDHPVGTVPGTAVSLAGLCWTKSAKTLHTATCLRNSGMYCTLSECFYHNFQQLQL